MDENPYISPAVAADDAGKGKRSDFGPLRMTATGFIVGVVLSSTAAAACNLLTWLAAAILAFATIASPAPGSLANVQEFLANCLAAIFVGAVGGIIIGAALGPAFGLATWIASDRSRKRLCIFSSWLFAVAHALVATFLGSACALKAGIGGTSLSVCVAVFGALAGAIAGAIGGWWIGKLLGNVAWGPADQYSAAQSTPAE